MTPPPTLLITSVRSYLSPRSFRIRCDNTFSSFGPCGIPKAQFLVPCFLSCTLPLSTLISSLSLNHVPKALCKRHLTLFLLSPTQLRLKHTHLQNALQQIFFLGDCQFLESHWICTNWTQKSNSTKYTTPHLILPSVHSVRNLGFIFNEHLTFSDQISSLSESYQTSLLYPSLPLFHYSWYHFDLHRSLQTRLL